MREILFRAKTVKSVHWIWGDLFHAGTEPSDGEFAISYWDDEDEWMTYNDMQHRIEEMLHEERVACGWSGVYEIVDGCSGDCLFEGDIEQCKIYTDIMLEQHPERQGNIIILPLY